MVGHYGNPAVRLSITHKWSHARFPCTKKVNSGSDKEGRWRQHKLCGVMMHASLAVTLDGLSEDLKRLDASKNLLFSA